jgi:hypothetical protein
MIIPVDGVGKTTGNVPAPGRIGDHELDQNIDILEGSIEQRELEARQSGPNGDPDGGHQRRIDKERALLRELQFRRFIRDGGGQAGRY